MTKIVLLCAAGMSTSLLVSKMQEYAQVMDREIAIAAYPTSEASEQAADADVILLGPQVRFQLADIQKQFPEKVVSLIDMRDYGLMDGKKVLEAALQLIEA